MSRNIVAYVEREKRPFSALPLCDADLLAFSALMYAEFERFDYLAGSVRLADLLEHASARQLVEHDYYPAPMEALVSALVSSPRFADVRMERFECVVDEERIMQFAAACFAVGEGQVVVAFRGTDSKLVGWHENFTSVYLEAMAGQVQALRYAHDAAAAYPDAALFVCGHSKGGSEAEYVALFADASLAARIGRAVSFDGPALFKNGGAAACDLEAFDQVLLERYQQLATAVTRYIFPSRIGLVMERRDAHMFPYTISVDPAHSHGACSVEVVEGELALRQPEDRDLHDALGLTRLVEGFTVPERKILVEEIIAACKESHVTIDLSERGIAKLAKAVQSRYRTLPRDRKRVLRKAIAKAMLSR